MQEKLSYWYLTGTRPTPTMRQDLGMTHDEEEAHMAEGSIHIEITDPKLIAALRRMQRNEGRVMKRTVEILLREALAQKQAA